MNATPTDPIARKPDIAGPHGKAWIVDLAVVRAQRKGGPNPNDTGVMQWIIEAPFAHPLWHSYSLMLIHLRPVEGSDQRPTIYLKGATHELWLVALDPDHERAPIFEGGSVHGLQPVNFAAQIIADSDAVAVGRIEAAVEMICDGDLSPDTDFRSAWVKLFGSNMLRN